MTSLSFDRAADFYDATRGLPAETLRAVVDILAHELRDRHLSLEIGVGTGRIALPLHRHGIGLVGADVSVPMLERLMLNAGGTTPFPLLLADATALPFHDGSVDAVLASHVFHLIPQWKAATDEALRVMRAGGLLLADFGGAGVAPWSKAAAAIFQRHGIDHARPGVSDPHKLATYVAGRATLRALQPATMSARRTLAKDLDEWQHQIHSWTWQYSPEQMAAACNDVRAWAETKGVPIEAEVELTRVIQWWAFDVTA
ncbi:MAG TPA: class I SAM-dependent methyltransferase [Acidimicrobiales bacterium]